MRLPARMEARQDFEDSSGAIPGQRGIPLVIAVERVEIPERPKIEVIRIAKSMGENLATGEIGLQPEQGAELGSFHGRIR